MFVTQHDEVQRPIRTAGIGQVRRETSPHPGDGQGEARDGVRLCKPFSSLKREPQFRDLASAQAIPRQFKCRIDVQQRRPLQNALATTTTSIQR